jgi:hypothetical protein
MKGYVEVAVRKELRRHKVGTEVSLKKSRWIKVHCRGRRESRFDGAVRTSCEHTICESNETEASR